jgi:hypothetical protein
MPTEKDTPFNYLGLTDKFSGIDLIQSQNYTKVHCSTYIHRLLGGAKGAGIPLLPKKSPLVIIPKKSFLPLPQKQLLQSRTTRAIWNFPRREDELMTELVNHERLSS